MTKINQVCIYLGKLCLRRIKMHFCRLKWTTAGFHCSRNRFNKDLNQIKTAGSGCEKACRKKDARCAKEAVLKICTWALLKNLPNRNPCVLSKQTAARAAVQQESRALRSGISHTPIWIILSWLEYNRTNQRPLKSEVGGGAGRNILPGVSGWSATHTR